MTCFSPPVVVADSGPLIALSVIGQLELLRRLYGQVLAPPAVWEEVTVRGRGLPGAHEVGQLSWLEIKAPETALWQGLAILVDRGEAEAVALAMKAELSGPHSQPAR
ncbi:hypothetical protein [uncultured Thiodictyon sp.]|jgi:predicted nucleic acid-binding protein|uniref:hypothetical protein n=1 Tax=uncultured Thiodictyon sp. TaxID=1846217 RepID=UPI0025F58E4F|nr:hypothetical protein [uncultured Thiodictyon sp.]